MIGKIFGTICDVGTNFLIVNVNGVGYIVYCSGKIIKNSHVDDIVSLVTQTIVKENDISIYGFIDNSEKEFLKQKIVNTLHQ